MNFVLTLTHKNQPLAGLRCPFSQLLVPQTVNGPFHFLHPGAGFFFALKLLGISGNGKTGALTLWHERDTFAAERWQDEARGSSKR